MRRKDRAITDRSVLEEIVRKADVCRIAFADGATPYIVTLNFGYEWNEALTFYFHCAKKGRKIDLMEKNDRVCFELDTDHRLTTSETACGCGMSYRSIVGYGKLAAVRDPGEKARGLDLIMRHYGFTGDKNYDEKIFTVTEVLQLEVREMTGKEKK